MKRNSTKNSKIKKRHKRYQEFIDEINGSLKEKRDIEDLLNRVVILKAEDVLKEMQIKEKNNEIMRHCHKKVNAAKLVLDKQN